MNASPSPLRSGRRARGGKRRTLARQRTYLAADKAPLCRCSARLATSSGCCAGRCQRHRHACRHAACRSVRPRSLVAGRSVRRYWSGSQTCPSQPPQSYPPVTGGLLRNFAALRSTHLKSQVAQNTDKAALCRRPDKFAAAQVSGVCHPARGDQNAAGSGWHSRHARTRGCPRWKSTRK